MNKDIDLQILEKHQAYADLRNKLALEKLTPEERKALEDQKATLWNELLALEEEAHEQRTLDIWGWNESWM